MASREAENDLVNVVVLVEEEPVLVELKSAPLAEEMQCFAIVGVAHQNHYLLDQEEEEHSN